MAKKTKTRGVNLPVPQSQADAAEAVRLIGIDNREIARIEADMNDAIAELKEVAESKAAPLKDRMMSRTEGLKVWAEANRSSLTNANKVKTADLGTGKIGWRRRPPSVRITGAERVIEAIKRLGLPQFIRTKEEVNKEAILADREKGRMIAGISIGSEGEDFFVEPFEAVISQPLKAQS